MRSGVKTQVIVIGAALCLMSARQVKSEPLSSADREALLESLERLREDADSKVDARFRLAIAAYREAMASEEAAMEFYLKCIEKVDFDDQQKKNADFRDWKRKEAENLARGSLRLALRYQLRWLVLTLRAASEKSSIPDLAVEAQEIVDSMFRDADQLGGQAELLSQPVTSTVFARAYEIGGLGKDKWPLSPMMLDQVYGDVIFPQLRTPSRLETLRSSWIKRIQQEGTKVEWPGNDGGNGSAIANSNGRKIGQSVEAKGPEMERFMTETVPELQWQMEMDLFRHGDESGSAMRMLAHIEKNLSHKSSRGWGDQLKNLLTPKTAAPAATEEPAPSP